MRKSILHYTAALALSGALALGAAAPGFAASLPGAVASLGKIDRGALIEVRWHGHGHFHGGGFAAGIGAGLVGAAIANQYYYGDPYYYGPPPYAYGPPPYAYGPQPVYAEPPVVYAQPPAVYAPPPGANGPVRQCWITSDGTRGYGYWQPC